MSQFAQTIETRLNGQSLALLSLLQTHEPAAQQRIQGEGAEAARLIAELRDKIGHRRNKAAFQGVEHAYGDLQEAVTVLLALDQDQSKAHETLNASTRQLASNLSDYTEAAVRARPRHAAARRKAAGELLEQVANLSKSLPKGEDPATREFRFHRTAESFANWGGTVAGVRWAETMEEAFDRCAIQEKELQAAQEKVQAALNRWTQKRNVFGVVIQESLLTGMQGRGWPLPWALAFGILPILLSGLLQAMGIVTMYRSDHRLKDSRDPMLDDLTRCAEAAAGGDVSRLPGADPRSDWDRLAKGVGRLITVLGRSENLVYHLAALVESSGEAIISVNLDGTVMSWNNGAQRMYGYSAAEMKGASVAVLSPYDRGNEMVSQLQWLRSGKPVRPFETLHQAKNKRAVQAFVRLSPILDSTRNVIGASFSAQELPGQEWPTLHSGQRRSQTTGTDGQTLR